MVKPIFAVLLLTSIWKLILPDHYSVLELRKNPRVQPFFTEQQITARQMWARDRASWWAMLVLSTIALVMGG